MSATGQGLDRVARIALAPVLKTQGFRIAGRTWRRTIPEVGVIQVVNVQGSSWNSGTEGRCVLNTGLYFRVLAHRIGIGAVTDAPTEPDCHLRVRPAMLKPDRLDTWFTFHTDDPSSERAAGEALCDLYEVFGAPWLARFAKLSLARDELVRTGQRWWASAASLELGDVPSARQLLEVAMSKAPKEHLKFLVQWGRENALLNDRGAAI
jgi:Domain of unknown function (DUF4304)